MTATVGMAMLSAAHLTASDGDVPSGIRLAARAVRIHEEYDFEPFTQMHKGGGLYEYEGYKTVFIKDSEGNTIEIAQQPEG